MVTLFGLVEMTEWREVLLVWSEVCQRKKAPGEFFPEKLSGLKQEANSNKAPF